MAIILIDPITQKPLLSSNNKVLLAPEIPSGAKTKQVLCLDPITNKLMKYSDGKAVILTVADTSK